MLKKLKLKLSKNLRMMLNISFKLVIGFAFFLSTQPSSAITQQKKLEILKRYFPKGTTSLTPDTLLLISLGHSTTIKTIQSQLISKDAAKLRAEALLDLKLTAETGYVLQKNKTVENGFPSPTESKQKNIGLGFVKNFASGTSLSGDIDITDTSSKLDPPQTDRDTKETSFELSLRQSLLKNAFGEAYQMQLAAAGLAPEVIEHSVAHSTEGFTLTTIKAYYDVWLAREMVLAAKSRLQSQERLLGVVTKQYKIGTSEKPEYLEIKIGKAQAVQSMKEATDQFHQSWRRLIIALRMPLELLDIQPLLVPMTPDNFIPRAREICRDNTLESVAQFQTNELKSAMKMKQSSELQYLAAKDSLKPDLFLQLATRGNSLEDSYGKSMGESLSHKNPRIYVGIGFEMFLDQPGNTAEAMANFQSFKLAELKVDDVRSENQVNWINHCETLKVLQTRQKFLFSSHRDLKERETLQEKRFRLGRVSAFDIHRATSGVTDNLQSLSAVKSQLRQVAWQLRGLAGEIEGHLKMVLAAPPEN